MGLRTWTGRFRALLAVCAWPSLFATIACIVVFAHDPPGLVRAMWGCLPTLLACAVLMLPWRLLLRSRAENGLDARGCLRRGTPGLRLLQFLASNAAALSSLRVLLSRACPRYDVARPVPAPDAAKGSARRAELAAGAGVLCLRQRRPAVVAVDLRLAGALLALEEGRRESADQSWRSPPAAPEIYGMGRPRPQVP